MHPTFLCTCIQQRLGGHRSSSACRASRARCRPAVTSLRYSPNSEDVGRWQHLTMKLLLQPQIPDATAELRIGSPCPLCSLIYLLSSLAPGCCCPCMTSACMLQVFFAPHKPDEGDGEIIDWVDKEEESGYMTPPTDTQPAAGLALPLQRFSWPRVSGCARHACTKLFSSSRSSPFSCMTPVTDKTPAAGLLFSSPTMHSGLSVSSSQAYMHRHPRRSRGQVL